jgi:hypothetical protein
MALRPCAWCEAGTPGKRFTRQRFTRQLTPESLPGMVRLGAPGNWVHAGFVLFPRTGAGERTRQTGNPGVILERRQGCSEGRG